MVLLFRTLEPRYTDPTVYLVVPDQNRFGYRSREIHDAVLRGVDWLFGCHVSFGVINEWAIARLPKCARALVWVMPYCPDSATFEHIRNFVAQGGALYFSGDIRFDARRRPTQGDRLAALGLSGDYGKPLPPFAAESESLPKNPIWGRIGKGQTCWVRRPIELSETPAGVDVYRAFLERAGMPRLRVAPDDPSIHVFELPLHNGNALVVFNDTRSRHAVEVQWRAANVEVVLDVDAGRPGLVVIGRDGQVIAAEAQGRVVVDDELVCEFQGHHALVSLDGNDVRASRERLLLPFGAGTTTVVNRNATGDWLVQIGEFRSGRFAALRKERIPTANRVRISIGESSTFDPRIISSPGHVLRAARAAARLLSRTD